MDGGVKGQIFTTPLSKQSVSCVFSTQIMLIIMLIIMLTLITIIFKGDITDFEIHLHLQMSWLHWRMVEPPGHGCSVELQAG